MRIRLSLHCIGEKRVLPVDYQYYLSAWFYKTINRSDSEFARWLHDEGFTANGRKFKLFTFSKLYLPAYEQDGDRLLLKSGGEVGLEVSFAPLKIMEHFITGLFLHQKLDIADHKSQMELVVTEVQVVPEPEFRSGMRFRCLSPILVSTLREGDRHAQYLAPDEERYAELIGRNLMNKYMAIHNQELQTEGRCKLKVLNRPKRKMVKVKPGKEGQIKLIAYQYDFEIETHPQLIKIGYFTGFGEKNSLGLGCCRIIY
jgi:CRISPR-associated endoribonuclease Cas6